MKKKTGGRKKGTPNKISSQVKGKLSHIINETIDSLDISVMNSNQKIKLIQIGLTYVVPRLKHTEKAREEPREFQIEIIDRLSGETLKH